MAPRLRAAPALLFLTTMIVLVPGCAPPGSGQQIPPGTLRATPQASFSVPVAATVALIRSALSDQGISVDRPVVPYSPAEPPSIAAAPRVILQADVRDPVAGYVVIYEFRDAPTAGGRGMELAGYLASGVGQVNYPLDAQFSLSQVGPTLAFTWWSRERSADAASAQRAFDAVGRVGQPIPVVK